MKTIQERYEQDNHFRVLVDVLTAYVYEGNFTPSELRAAAVFACVRYEMLNVRKSYIIPEHIEDALVVLNNWASSNNPFDQTASSKGQ